MDHDNEKPLLGRQLKLPDNFSYIKAWIGVSSGLILYMLCTMSFTPLVSQYVVYRLSNATQHNLTTNDTAPPTSIDCNKTQLGAADQQLVQTEASTLTLYYSLASAAAAIAVNLFLGPMSDCIGRRVLFVLPLVGLILKAIVLCFVVYFNLDMNFIYLAYTLDGLCGSNFAILVAAFTYSADITVPGRSRTIAMACMEGCLAIAAACGALASGYLIKSTGYFYPCLMFAIIAVLDLFLVLVFLQETLTEKKELNKSPIYHIKNVFRFYFTGPLRRRCLYILGLSIFFLAAIVILGRSTLETIYQLGAPFCWDPVKVGYFGGLRLTVQRLCSVAAIKIFQSWISDEKIAIISNISGIGSFIFEALATSSLMMYLVPVVGIIGSATGPIGRALLSKMTPPEQQGALFASVALIEILCNTSSYSLYNLVFNATVSYYKGAVWFMMAGMCVVNILFLFVYICVSNGETKRQTNKTSENTEYGSINS